jgi:hypothetical protein
MRISNIQHQTLNIELGRRRGYVLIVTLALLVLSATAMVVVGRMSLRQITVARQAQDDLQQRWGVISIRVAIMPFAEQILQTAEGIQKRAVPSMSSHIMLANQSFDVVISDEQAKANVNAMLGRANRNVVETRLRQVLAGQMSFKLRLRPEPLPPPARGPVTRPATQPILPQQISGFGQIFDDANPQNLLMLRYIAVSPASMITCWGNGAINLRRASEASLRLMLSPPATNIDVSHLIAARDAMLSGKKPAMPAQSVSQAQIPALAPADPVRRMLSQAGASPDIASRLTLGSSCHSLWIVAQPAGREWYYLTVLDESDPKQARMTSMRW